MARSSKQLFDLAERFNANGISLVSLKEGTDTSTPQGRFFFAMCAAMAQFERELIKERQAEGIAAAKARGRQFGRPATDPSKMDTAVRLYQDGGLSVNCLLYTSFPEGRIASGFLQLRTCLTNCHHSPLRA